MFLAIFKGEAGWDVDGAKPFKDYFSLVRFFWAEYIKGVHWKIKKYLPTDRPVTNEDFKTLPKHLRINIPHFGKWLMEQNYNRWLAYEIRENGMHHMKADELMLWADRAGFPKE